MRKTALLASLLFVGCSDAAECENCFPSNTEACAFGTAAVTLTATPAPPQGSFGFDGVATVTQTIPLTLALDERSIAIGDVTTALEVGDQVDVSLSGFCPFWCDMSIVIADTNGFLLAAWDTTSMASVEVPGWVVTYSDENCVLLTGDPVVPAIASVMLTAEHAEAALDVGAGMTDTLDGYTVLNGQSTVNTHQVGANIPDRWFRGAVVRQ